MDTFNPVLEHMDIQDLLVNKTKIKKDPNPKKEKYISDLYKSTETDIESLKKQFSDITKGSLLDIRNNIHIFIKKFEELKESLILLNSIKANSIIKKSILNLKNLNKNLKAGKIKKVSSLKENLNLIINGFDKITLKKIEKDQLSIEQESTIKSLKMVKIKPNNQPMFITKAPIIFSIKTPIDNNIKSILEMVGINKICGYYYIKRAMFTIINIEKIKSNNNIQIGVENFNKKINKKVTIIESVNKIVDKHKIIWLVNKVALKSIFTFLSKNVDNYSILLEK